jgi:endonuclease/exonuclease/phosphatase family metal-dependent hydrolase
MKIATYNLENLFTRPAAMRTGVGAQGTQALADFATLNRIVEKPVYSEPDKATLIDLAQIYGFHLLSAPSNALIQLQKIREQLYTTAGGTLSIKAKGRGDWTGWFELRRDDLVWEATMNTARVLDAVKPDIVVCVEVENRVTLLRFNEQVLGASFKMAYPHVMLIDGNDERGIDVGILSRYPLNGVRSHIDDRSANGERIFSRDCPEYVVELPNAKRLVVMPNHFKSKRGGDTPQSSAKRLAQATRAHAIAKAALQISPLVLVAGDLNDTPDSTALAPVFTDGFADVQGHPRYPTDRPGTYATGLASGKIDYLIMSPALRSKLTDTGIERRGTYHPQSWTPFPTVTNKNQEASDHHCLWGVFDL